MPAAGAAVPEVVEDVGQLEDLDEPPEPRGDGVRAAQAPGRAGIMKPLVVLALPGMYLFYKYSQYRREQRELSRRRITERELQHLHHKIMYRIQGKRKGTFVYIHEGYGYHLDNRGPSEIYRCATRSTTSCTATAVISHENVVTVDPAHDGLAHTPNLTRIEEKNMIEDMLQQCREKTSPLKKIFDRVCLGDVNVGSKLVFREVKPMLERERAMHRPPVPASVRDLGEVLNDYQPTATIYRGIVEADDGSVALIFASNAMLNELKIAKELYGDGTFKITPHRPRAIQLYTFHTRIMDTGVPLVYALTTARTTPMYRAIIERLLELAPDLQGSLKFVMGDYERAAMAAIRGCFPEAALHGCWFHFNQAVLRKWRQLGLRHAPTRILRWVMALPLAPDRYFEEGIELLSRLADEIADEHPAILIFVLYLRRQWAPLARIVSVYGCPSRTDNLVESFHQAVKVLLGGIHPNIWIFLDHLTDLLQQHEMTVIRLRAGRRVRQLRPLRSVSNDAGIREAQQNLVEERFTLEEFLLRCTTLTENNLDVNGAVQQPVDPNEPAQRDLVDAEWMTVGEPESQVQGSSRNLRRGREPSPPTNTLHEAGEPSTAPGVSGQGGRGRARASSTVVGRGRGRRRVRGRGRGRVAGIRNLTSSSSESSTDGAGWQSPIHQPAIGDGSDGPLPITPPANDAGYNWRDRYGSDDSIFRLPEDDYDTWSEPQEVVPFHPVLPASPPTDNSGARERNCTICKAADVTHAFVPCGHRCACTGCVAQLQETDPPQCPICRTVFTLAIFVRDP